jgi:hypothetical protein
MLPPTHAWRLPGQIRTEASSLQAEEIRELVKAPDPGNALMIARGAQALASNMNETKPCPGGAGNVIRQAVADKSNLVGGQTSESDHSGEDLWMRLAVPMYRRTDDEVGQRAK